MGSGTGTAKRSVARPTTTPPIANARAKAPRAPTMKAKAVATAEPNAEAWSRRAYARLNTLGTTFSCTTRIRAIMRLAQSPANVTELAFALKVSQPALSHHLALLRTGGMIRGDRNNKFRTYSLTRRGAEIAMIARSYVIIEDADDEDEEGEVMV